MNIIPVNTLRTPSGALHSLIRVLGEENAKPIELSTGDNPYTNFNVMGRSISTSLAAKLGLGSIFDGTLNANEQAWWFDAATYTDKWRSDAAGTGAIQMTRWGVGLRVAMRVYNIKGGVSINYGIVGAAVQMGLAQAQYEITGIGIGKAGLMIVLDNMSLTGELTGESYFKLTSTVAKQLRDYMAAHPEELTAQPMAVGIVQNLDEDKFATAQAIYYAMKSIANGRSIKSALERALPTYDRDVIRFAYGVVAGNIPDSQEPSDDAEHNAEKWLKTP
jgi:hypothetical protein